MKRPPRLLILLLLTAVVLTGCKPSSRSALSSGTSPEENSASGSKVSQDGSPQSTIVYDAGVISGVGIHTEGSLDGTGLYYTYSGGEMELELYLRSKNLREAGVGILLFLDGQPQPYILGNSEKAGIKPGLTDLDTSGDAAYMQVVYPRSNVEEIYSISFTPITGQAGDTLELCVLFLPAPDTYPTSWQLNWFNPDDAWVKMTRVKMEQTPPEAEAPQVPDRVLSSSIEYEDIDLSTYVEDSIAWNLYWKGGRSIFLWKNFQDSIDPNSIILSKTLDQIVISREETIDLNFVFFGKSDSEYSLILYVDGEPVFFDGKTLAFRAEENQKLLLSASLDNSDFDETRIVFAVLLRRNCCVDGEGWKYYLRSSDIRAAYYCSEGYLTHQFS